MVDLLGHEDDVSSMAFKDGGKALVTPTREEAWPARVWDTSQPATVPQSYTLARL